MPFFLFCMYLSNAAVMNGQRNSVMIEAVAHCAVARLVYCAIAGSASATATGVRAEFNAVVQTAAPIALRSFFGIRRFTTKKNTTAVAAEISPRRMPDAPA